MKKCLGGLAFCDQLIVVDLGSSDESVKIAETCGAEVFHHDWEPIVEKVWPFAFAQARNKWIVRVDPDEVFPPALVDDMFHAIGDGDEVAMVMLPWQYYFKGIQLTTTVWGGIRYIGRAFQKDCIELTQQVHRGMKLKPGCKTVQVDYSKENAIQHYWVDSTDQLIEKSKRYIKTEGESKYKAGKRFSFVRFVYEILRAFWISLIAKRGIWGGLTGIYLSFFYAWYIAMANLSLLKYERTLSK